MNNLNIILSKYTIFLVFFLSNINQAISGGFTKKNNQFFLLIENNISSNSVSNFSKYDFTPEYGKYISEENKMYWEYGIFDNFSINGYLKETKIDLKFNIFGKKRLRNNYFANLALQYKILQNEKTGISFKISNYHPIKYANILKITSNLDIYDAVEYTISFAHSFENFLGKYNTNFINLDLNYRSLSDSFKDNFNLNLSFGRKINLSSLIIFEYIYNKDININNNKTINNYYYKVYADSNKKNKINKNLINEYQTFKINSITNFTDNFAFKASLEKSFYKNNDKSYGISLGFWFFN